MEEKAAPSLITERIDQVIRETLQAVQEGKEKIFQIGDLAREEHVRLTAEMESLRGESAKLATDLADLEHRARAARTRLAEYSRDFHGTTEEDLRRAYQAAEEAQLELSLAHARAKALIQRREQLDGHLRQVEGLMRKAEELVNAVSIAIEFLTGRTASRYFGASQRTMLATQIIQAQEEERRRVAREIHDGPAQAMANLVLRAEICEKTMETGKGDLRGELLELKRLAKDCLKEVRRIIFDLRPMALDDLGLVPTLHRYLEELRKEAPFALRLGVLGKERRLASGIEAALFRFVQEALNNCRKYAQATRAEVKVEFLPGLVRVVVEDDGVGFDPAELPRRTSGQTEHFGLLGMRERMELFNGTFQLFSAPGKGTRVVAQIPLEGAVGEGGSK